MLFNMNIWGLGFNRSETGIVGSNPAQGMDVSLIRKKSDTTQKYRLSGEAIELLHF
jgi:hypothetical protein